jgi:uncharacterized protein (TIGR03437 family)
MFIVFGQNMGPANLVQVNSLPVPATLGGTTIRVTVGGTTVSALMIYSSGRQVAAVLPSNTATGDGTLTLTFNNQTSAPAPIRVVPSSFGMFTRNSGGSGPAIVQNFISQTQQPTNGLIAAAQPGQTVILWGSGLGPVAGNEAAGPLPGDLGIPVEVYVGNQPATIAYRGRSGCCVGIDQIVFTVPPGVEGCYIPVAVRVGGVTGNIGTMSINSAGNVCSDPVGFSLADLAKVQSNSPITVADIALTRAQVSLNFPGLGTGSGAFDYAEGEFKNYRALDLLASAGFRCLLTSRCPRWVAPFLNSATRTCSNRSFRPAAEMGRPTANWTPVRRSTLPARRERRSCRGTVRETFSSTTPATSLAAVSPARSPVCRR